MTRLHRHIVASLSLSPRSGGCRTFIPIALWVRARVRARAHRRPCHPRCVEVAMTGDGDGARTAFVFTWRGSVEGRDEGEAPSSSTVVLTNEL